MDVSKISNMKLYFSMYLPVEGEIKEGDWFWSTPEVQGKKLWQNTSAITATSNMLYGYHLQKVKLFICSRDIQIGDEFYNPFHIKVDHLFDEEDIQDNLKDHFKIIGPVSEAALSFVIEGQEFDRKDLRIFKTADSYSSKIITEMLGEKWEHKEDHIITPGKVIYVKIKNVDGKFY